jgi:hypothetical protein
VADDHLWQPEVYGWRGALDRPRHVLTELVADLLTESSPPVTLRDAVAAADCPVLLVTAGAVPDEGHAAAFIEAGAPDRVETWEVPGASHTGGLAADPTGWSARVTGFLDDALAP